MRQISHLRPLNEPGASLDVAILDAEQRQSLVALRSLGMKGLRVGVFEWRHAPAFDSRWCRATGLVADSAVDRDLFARDVLGLVERHTPRVVILAHDGTIEAVRAHRAELEDHTTFALAGDDALSIAVDKTQTYKLAAELGIPVPRTAEIADISDLADGADYVGFPLVIKSTRSWVHRGASGQRLAAEPAANLRQALEGLERVFAAGGSAVVQQWVGGRREAVSAIYASGRFWARFAQVAYRMFPPLGGSSIMRESIALPSDLVTATDALVDAIGLDGYSEVEFRRDHRGRAFLMEINPRLSASVEIAVRAGVDFPALIYACALGRPMTVVRRYRVGVRMRWLGGDIRWLRRTLQTQGLPDSLPALRALTDFVSDTFRPAYYDYLVLSDLRPAVTATVEFLRRARSQARQGQAQHRKAPAVR